MGDGPKPESTQREKKESETMNGYKNLSDLSERAVAAVQFAHDAKNGLLCGSRVVDVERLALADGYVKSANVAWRNNDVVGAEIDLSWAIHYAKTCGA